MKYSVETTENGYVETLEVNGKEYKKRWKYKDMGHYQSNDAEFFEQLEEDGVEDVELLDRVCDRIDCLSFGIDLFEASLGLF